MCAGMGARSFRESVAVFADTIKYMGTSRTAKWVGAAALAVVALVSMAAAFALRSGVSASSTAPSPLAAAAAGPMITWDLTGERPTSAIGRPRDATGDIYIYPAPGRLTVAVPGGTFVADPYTHVDVQRLVSSDTVRNVKILLPAESLDAAYARALSLIDQWHLVGKDHVDAKDSLKQWNDRIRGGYVNLNMRDGDWQSDTRGKTYPKVGIAVLSTGYAPKPWCVVWAIMFAPPEHRPIDPKQQD